MVMIILLVLLFRMTLPSLALVTTDLFEKNETFVNILCPSASLDFGVVRTVTGCASKCTSIPLCWSFFYNKEGKFCKGSKDLILSAAGCEPMPDTVYYQITECVNYGSTYTEYLDMNLAVVYTDQFLDTPLSECQSHCSSSLACHGVNYNSATGRCRLKIETPFTNPSDFQPYPGVNYYLRNCA